jgi:hypothetical protein
MEDIVHDINSVILFFFIFCILTSKNKKVNQCTANSITVPSTWRNVVLEETKKPIIKWKKTGSSANLTMLRIELIERVLVRGIWTMETMANTEGISKKLSKPVEVGLTGSSASHPHHGVFLILFEGKSGVKLLNAVNALL